MAKTKLKHFSRTKRNMLVALATLGVTATVGATVGATVYADNAKAQNMIVSDKYAFAMNNDVTYGQDSGGFHEGNIQNNLTGRYQSIKVSEIASKKPYMIYSNVGTTDSGQRLDLKIQITGATGYGEKYGYGIIGFAKNSIYVTSFGIKDLKQTWTLVNHGTQTPNTEIKGMMYGFQGIDFGQHVTFDKNTLATDSVFENNNGSEGYKTGRSADGKSASTVFPNKGDSRAHIMRAPSGTGTSLYYRSAKSDPTSLMGDGYSGNNYVIQGSASNMSSDTRALANLFINFNNGSFSFTFSADGTVGNGHGDNPNGGQGNSSALESGNDGWYRGIHHEQMGTPTDANRYYNRYAGENYFYNAPAFNFQPKSVITSEQKISDTSLSKSNQFTAMPTTLKRTTNASANKSWYNVTKSTTPKTTTGSVDYSNFIIHQFSEGVETGVLSEGNYKVYSSTDNGKTYKDETSNFDIKTGAGNVYDYSSGNKTFRNGDVVASMKSTTNEAMKGKTFYLQSEDKFKSGGDFNTSTRDWTDTSGTNHHGLKLANGKYLATSRGDSSVNSPVSGNKMFAQANAWRMTYLEQDAEAQTVSGALTDTDSPTATGVKQVTRDMNNTGGAYGYKYTTTTPFVTNKDVITSKISDYYTSANTKYGIDDAKPNFSKGGKDVALLNANGLTPYLANGKTKVDTSSEIVGGDKTVKWGDSIELYQTGTTLTGLTSSDKPNLDKALSARRRLIGNNFVLVGHGYGNSGSNLAVTDLKVKVPDALTVTSSSAVSEKSLGNGGTTADFKPTIKRTTDNSANNTWYAVTTNKMPDSFDGMAPKSVDLSVGTLGYGGNTNVDSIKVYRRKSNDTTSKPVDVTSKFSPSVVNSDDAKVVSTSLTKNDIAGWTYYTEIGLSWGSGQNLASYTGAWSDTTGTSRKGIKLGTGDYAMSSWYRTVLDTGSPATMYNPNNDLTQDKLAYLEQVAQKQSVTGALTETDTPKANGVKQVTRDMNNVDGKYGYKYTLSAPFVNNSDVTTSKISDYYTGASTKYGIGDATPNFSKGGKDVALLNATGLTPYSSDGNIKLAGTTTTGKSGTIKWGGSVVLYQTGTTLTGLTSDDKTNLDKALNARKRLIGNTFALTGNGYGNNGSNLTVTDLKVKVPDALTAKTTSFVSNKSFGNGGKISDLQPTIKRTTDSSANNTWYTVAKTEMPSSLAGTTIKNVDLSTGLDDPSPVADLSTMKIYRSKTGDTTSVPTDVTSKFTISKYGGDDVSVTSDKLSNADVAGYTFYVEVGQTWRGGADLSKSGNAWTDTTGARRKGIKVSTGDYTAHAWYRNMLNTGSPATSFNPSNPQTLNGLAYLEQVAQKQSVSGVLTNTDDPTANGGKSVDRGMNNVDDKYGYKYTLSAPFVTNKDVITTKVSDFYTSANTNYGIGDATPNFQKSGKDTALLDNGGMTVYTADGKSKVDTGASVIGTGKTITWGGTVELYQNGKTTTVSRSDYTSAKKALDARRGSIGNSLVVKGDGFGNSGSNLSVTDLKVNVKKLDATVHYYKDGTTTKSTNFASPVRVENPNTVADTKVNDWAGLPVNATPANLTGWDYVTSSYTDGNNNPLIGRDDIWFSYSKHKTTAHNRKVSVYTAQKADNSAKTSATNKATGHWQSTVAITMNKMWKNYKISTDKDLLDTANQETAGLTGVDGSNYSFEFTKPVKEVVQNNADGTVNVTAYYTHTGTYNTSSDNVTTKFDDSTFKATKSAKTPWLRYGGSNDGALSAKANVASGTNINGNDLDAVGKLGIIREKTFSQPAVSVAVSNDSVDGTKASSKTYNETYDVRDDASQFSTQAGYGFTNQVTIKVNTYDWWNVNKDMSKNDSGYSATTYNSSATFSPDMLTQSENKATTQSNVYKSKNFKRSANSNDGSFLTNSVEANKVQYTMVQDLNNSYVSKGLVAKQTFADKSKDANYRNAGSQILVPSDAKVGSTLSMAFNYGTDVPKNKALFFNNPKFVLGKKITISAPRYIASNDNQLIQNQTPIAVTTPHYDSSNSRSDVDKFVNK